MAEQQDLQAYVRQRMAGTEPPPAPPGPNPMASYVQAQASGGLTVPPRTMMDSHQYLVTETGDEPVTPGIGPNAVAVNPAHDAYFARQNALMRQMDSLGIALDALPRNHPDRPALSAQFDQLQKQWDQLTNPGPAWLNQTPPSRFAGDPAAATIQGAVDARRSAPRQPIKPPAPGGVPTGIPVDGP